MKLLAIAAAVCLSASAASAVTVNVTVGPGLTYSPNPVSIDVGDTVQWNWAGGVAHSSTSNSSSPLETWDSGVKTTGSFSHTFTHPGSWGYFCTVHGLAMTGSVQVSAPATTAVPALSSRALLLLAVALALIGAIAVTR